MIQIVILFLVAMAALAVIGRVKRGIGGKTAGKPAKCRSCGRHIIGKGPCPCRKRS